MANFGKDESPAEPVITKISHETLAEMVGTIEGAREHFYE
jgi:hypothetical protein